MTNGVREASANYDPVLKNCTGRVIAVDKPVKKLKVTWPATEPVCASFLLPQTTQMVRIQSVATDQSKKNNAAESNVIVLHGRRNGQLAAACIR